MAWLSLDRDFDFPILGRLNSRPLPIRVLLLPSRLVFRLLRGRLAGPLFTMRILGLAALVPRRFLP